MSSDKQEAVSAASETDSLGTTSDTESWTILDEDDEEVDHDLTTVVDARVDVVEKVAVFTKRDVQEDTDSDIETLDRTAPEECLDSLPSDGIPVGEELNADGDQYIWSSETDLTTSQEDQEDVEILEPAANAQPVDATFSSGYPPEELLERFSEIVKGRTYKHKPNQRLNLCLSGALVIVVALVMGLGVGHFLGWSERLELQEQFAELREEKLDELTDSLVTCMTGEEGMGGDDQDLDDRVIRQLSEENQQLKEELMMLKHRDHRASEEMSAILRDRVNDLLLANADLEKEVAKLRYGAGPPPPVVISHNVNDKERVNILQTENEELKTEVRRMRYSAAPNLVTTSPANDTLDQDDNIVLESDPEPNFIIVQADEKKAKNDVSKELFANDDSEAVVEIEEPKPKVVVTKSPPLPPVILLGGRTKVETPQEDLDSDEGFVEVEDDEEEEEQDADEEKVAKDYFKTFTNLMSKSLYKPSGWGLDMAKVEAVVGEFKTTASKLIPDKDKVKESAEQLSSVLNDKWSELDFIKEKKVVDKLAKTLVGALKRAKEVVSEEFAPDAVLWSERLKRVQAGFQRKWNEIVVGPGQKHEDQCMENKPAKKSYTSWSSGSQMENRSSVWIFKRAKDREVIRSDQAKSDWIFDRATDRKRFHTLLTKGSEWHSRRVYSRFCRDNDCDDLDKINVAAINQGQKRPRGDTSQVSGQARPNIRDHHDSYSAYARTRFRGYDPDDDDDDDDEDDLFDHHLHTRQAWKVANKYPPGQNAKLNKVHKSKKGQKRSRYHHRSTNDHHHRKAHQGLFQESAFAYLHKAH